MGICNLVSFGNIPANQWDKSCALNSVDLTYLVVAIIINASITLHVVFILFLSCLQAVDKLWVVLMECLQVFEWIRNRFLRNLGVQYA